MTVRPLHLQPQSSIPISWAAIGVIATMLVTFGTSVAALARVSERVDHLQETTQPLRDGDLVKIQTDVAWIRERIEREERR